VKDGKSTLLAAGWRLAAAAAAGGGGRRGRAPCRPVLRVRNSRPGMATARRRLRSLSHHLSLPNGSDSAPLHAAPAGAGGSGTEIASVEAMHVRRPKGGTCLVFVKITTDNGVVGWGEATNSGRNQSTAEAVMEGARYLYGKDPWEIERHWQHIYRGTFRRGGPVLCSALAGIEMALFDIKGKQIGVPVYELLGGKVREKVRCYAHMGSSHPAPHLDPYVDPAERREALEDFDATEWAKKLTVSVNGVPGIHPNDSPFTAFKVGIVSGMEMVERPNVFKKAVSMFAAIREVVGDDCDIATDFHGRSTPMNSKILCKLLEPHFPLFVEEAMHGQDGAEGAEMWRELSDATAVPLATGERLCGGSSTGPYLQP
jgi:L-alanine-DL-glutamate epimerase-like enolase superfamily enzyme